MESTNKKRTAAAAVATAAALLLSGTFAWVMKDDQTELNKFTAKAPGTYKVELKENFDPADPWANKDVYVENQGDNPVIVRVRLEEFYDLTYRNGTEYNVKKGLSNGDADGKAIFNTNDSVLNEDGTADSSTGIDKNVILKFGENGAGVVTMANWNALNTNLSAAKTTLKGIDQTTNPDAYAAAQQAVADAQAAVDAVKWVVDEDGWCYYVHPLFPNEITPYLLDDVDFDETYFFTEHSAPYNLDYKINVRLQAISADLEDFGSHLNDAQWTNLAYIDGDGNEITDYAGRIITEDERSDDYEILDDQTISDDALTLVTKISGEFVTAYTEGYKNADGSVARRVETPSELVTAMVSPSVHSILLTENITLTSLAPSSNPFILLHNYYGNKMIDLGDYTLDVNTDWSYLFGQANSGEKLSIRNGTLKLNGKSLLATLSGEASGASDIELVNVNIIDAESIVPSGYLQPGSNIKITNSNIETNNLAFAPKSNTDVVISSSQIISKTTNAIPPYGDASNVNIKLESPNPDNRTVISSAGEESYGLMLGKDWTLNANDATIIGGYYGVCENHNGIPSDSYLNNCIINATVGYYKAAASKLTMKNSTINATGLVTEDDPDTGCTAAGLVIRSGDVKLDNVNVTTSQGTFPTSDFIWSDQELLSKYNSPYYADGPVPNFEPIQVILNQYDSINLSINGGSYTSTYQGHDRDDNPVTMRSVYIHDSIYTIHTEGSGYEYPYTYNNTITISGNPTFSPETTVFDQTYTNTTINK